jgi:ribonuclease HI
MTFDDWWATTGGTIKGRKSVAKAAWNAGQQSNRTPPTQRAKLEFDATLYCDGACEPNPGPCAWAFVAYDHNHNIIHRAAGFIGEGTCNVAEWEAVLEAIKYVHGSVYKRILIRSDSKLIVNQLTGRWRCKKPHLQPYLASARSLAKTFEKLHIAWIPREQNQLADELAGKALAHAARESEPANPVFI